MYAISIARYLVKLDEDSADGACSIQTWALEEARRRLEAEGILEDPDKKR